MIPIIAFSWQDFRPVQVPNVSVGELYELAQHSPDLFVFHDPEYKESALVIPERLMTAVDELELSPDKPAAETELMSLLRQDQMIVRWSDPANLVARQAAEQEAIAVVVVNEEAIPVGLFIPSVVAEHLSDTTIVGESSSELQQTVEELSGRGDVAEAIAAIEVVHDEFHSEGLNSATPNPYVCEGYGKSHMQSRCPCDDHPAAPCGRRGVASR